MEPSTNNNQRYVTHGSFQHNTLERHSSITGITNSTVERMSASSVLTRLATSAYKATQNTCLRYANGFSHFSCHDKGMVITHGLMAGGMFATFAALFTGPTINMLLDPKTFNDKKLSMTESLLIIYLGLYFSLAGTKETIDKGIREAEAYARFNRDIEIGNEDF